MLYQFIGAFFECTVLVWLFHWCVFSFQRLFKAYNC